jgi:hypothetical protein
MRRAVLLLVLLVSHTATAGELAVDVGLAATTTAWPDDSGGGTTLDATWWFRSWLGASFVGKEQYAPVDERFLSYFSVNAAARRTVGPVRIAGELGVVHQHEEPRAALMDQPIESLFGVADGTRHRAAGRAGVHVALPFAQHGHGDWYVALAVDSTAFAEAERGPRWMIGAGLAVGLRYDFAKAPR